MIVKKAPHPIDERVGHKIRHRRWQLDMSQTELADKIGVRFQQVQKYERGINRISASRLWETSIALEVPITYFFVNEARGQIDQVTDSQIIL